jgi:hypothetical protein
MTTLLPTSELAMIRSIKGAALVLLVMLRLDGLYPGRAISDYELADILEIDRRTVAKQMRSLSAANLLLEQRSGRYVVTLAGRNTLFWPNRQPGSLSIEESGVPSAQSLLNAQNVLNDEDEEDSINDSDINSSSSSIKSAQNVQILDETWRLFGASVSTAGLSAEVLDFFEPEWALAWVAKAYADRNSLRNPQGLIYQRLKRLEAPSATIMAQYPISSLPAEYLDAIERYEQVCPRCRATFTSLVGYQQHQEHCLMTPLEDGKQYDDQAEMIADETVQKEIPGSPFTAEQAWKHVLEQLEKEMPSASFKTWVADTQALHFEADCIQVGVRNAYARDWLESRLQSTIVKLLQGLTNQGSMTLVFIIGGGVSAETEGE